MCSTKILDYNYALLGKTHTPRMRRAFLSAQAFAHVQSRTKQVRDQAFQRFPIPTFHRGDGWQATSRAHIRRIFFILSLRAPQNSLQKEGGRRLCALKFTRFRDEGHVSVAVEVERRQHRAHVFG
jgi:hypothetical protein